MTEPFMVRLMTEGSLGLPEYICITDLPRAGDYISLHTSGAGYKLYVEEVTLFATDTYERRDMIPSINRKHVIYARFA